jgi:Tfp pilus assembly protein PilX
LSVDLRATIRAARARRQEGGAVLIIVLMIMIVILGLGMMALWLTSGNLQVGGNMNLRTQALYAAEAGIERARAVLNAPTAPNVVSLLTGSNPTWDNVPTSVDATTGQPNGVGAIMMDSADALRNIPFPPASFARSSGSATNPTSAQMGTYTVWIRNDLAEVRRGRYTNDADGAVVVRSRGVASDGRTNVVLEVTMVPSALVTGNPPTTSAQTGQDCYAGKNACADSSSTQYGLVINFSN